ncbi:MAG: hypothetical protein ABIX28_06150 [Vicinamibacterales bacterium]
MNRLARLVVLVVAAGLLGSGRSIEAHSGPPFPIVSDRIVGPYRVSIWTDPDTTDDGKASGQFWVVIEAAVSTAAVPADTQARVAIRPLDRDGPPREGRAEPVNGAVERQFVALLMDHEGPFGVRVAIAGPLGRAELEGQVDATYDLRPAPGLIALYLVPFALVGALWVKVLLRRRHRRPPAAP